MDEFKIPLNFHKFPCAIKKYERFYNDDKKVARLCRLMFLKEKETHKNGVTGELRRQHFIYTTISELSHEWKCDRQTVTRFLDECQDMKILKWFYRGEDAAGKRTGICINIFTLTMTEKDRATFDAT